MSKAEKDKAMNAMVLRLEEWAQWYSGSPYGLGYATTSLAYLISEGVVSGGVKGRHYLPSNPKAEEIEAWVMEMGQCYPLMAEVLRGHYFEGGSLREQALRLPISHTQVKYWLDRAHRWLIWRKHF